MLAVQTEACENWQGRSTTLFVSTYNYVRFVPSFTSSTLPAQLAIQMSKIHAV